MGWLSKLFHLENPQAADSTKKDTSKDDACKRLKLVLMHDRTQMSPTVLEAMRDELVDVIAKYVEIDKNALDLNFESESNTIALVANIPVVRMRTANVAAIRSNDAQKPVTTPEATVPTVAETALSDPTAAVSATSDKPSTAAV